MRCCRPASRRCGTWKTAQCDKTATRERVCLNGLWRWQPAKDATDAVPEGRWGYFKVARLLAGTLQLHPGGLPDALSPSELEEREPRERHAAWYQREITVPDDWTGRRIALSAEYVNSFAVVYVDGKKAGEMRFPAGEVDLTAMCQPGKDALAQSLVVAMPLKAVLLSYTDTNSARK